MISPYAIYPSPRTVTYAAIAAPTAIKTSIATAVAPQTYTGVALNGATGAGVLPFPQTISATSASHSGSYIVGSPITVTGLDALGAVQTDTITLTLVNGNETISTVKAFASVTSIVVPAMNDTAGAFTFGVNDIIVPSPFRQLRAGSAGNVVVGYVGGFTDTLPCLQGERHDVLALSIKNTLTTALPLTVYV